MVDRTDLLVGIEEIWALMGQPKVRDMEARFLEFDAMPGEVGD